MLSTPKQQEIDPRTLKLIVGAIAISLPFLTYAFAAGELASISASYYQDTWSRTIFIGFLFAIASFLLAHNGVTKNEMILSKIASVAGLLVALFPCEPPDGDGTAAIGPQDPNHVPYVHGAAAAVMFVVLAFFCVAFYRRAKVKARTLGFREANRRAAIYVLCFVAIVLAILALALDFFLDHRFSNGTDFIFWGEAVALVAFGIAWFTASKVVPALAGPEHFSPLRADNPQP